MSHDLTTNFTGLKFVNPFVLASAPPTESKRKILKAFEAGWGGVVTKTIGLHPVENVAGPKTIYQRVSEEKPYVSRTKRPDTVSHSSWNWELISDQPLEQWLPDLKEIKETYPDVQVKQFPAEVIEALRASNDELIASESARSEIAARIIASQKAYLEQSRAWTEIGEKLYLDSVAQ